MAEYIAKWPDEQGHIHWTETENQTWSQLITRQLKTIEQRACDAFIDGVDQLGLATDRVPQLAELNQKLVATGWEMVPVSGTVGVNDFFTMLKNRQFPVANFIRVPEELDYLKQPDVFHELFGHGPLLLNSAYADFVAWYGHMVLQAAPKLRPILSRLFWYTIEFGLLKTNQGMRIYGGGILSSHQETLFSLESTQPQRRAFDINTILQTPYDYQSIQQQYFYLDDLADLYQLIESDMLTSCLNTLHPETQAVFVNC